MRRDSHLRLPFECLVKLIVLSTIFIKPLACSFESKPVNYSRAKSVYATTFAFFVFVCFLTSAFNVLDIFFKQHRKIVQLNLVLYGLDVL